MGAVTAGVPFAVQSLTKSAFAAKSRPRADQLPNIVLILADDMGWTDWEGENSPLYDTPSLQRLRSESMYFSQAYAANPLCSPTRASILTGKYPGRLRLTGAIVNPPGSTEIDDPQVRTTGASWAKVTIPEFRTYLPLEEYTIAEALKTLNYATVHIGKWHLGNSDWFPEHQGFDQNIGGGHYPGPPSYFSPYNIATLTDGPTGEYITDRLTTEAENFIEANQSNPFFLNFWHYAVHAPYQGKSDLIDTFDAVVDPESQHRNTTYAAMIKSLDQSVGRILDKLDALNLTNDTIVIFMSDNGGVDYEPNSTNEYVSSNAPLRGGKARLYEGGTREPMLVRWPGHVEANSTCDTVVSTVDYYPTLLEIAGLNPYPGQILDGESLVPLLEQSGGLQRESIFCHFPHYIHGPLPPGFSIGDKFWNLPGCYVRKGNYKLIRFFGEGETNEENGHELYNIREDIRELNDLSYTMPEKVAELSALIDDYLADTGSLVPLPNPLYGIQVDGWAPTKNVEIAKAGGLLLITALDTDPILTGPTFSQPGPLSVQIRLKTDTSFPTGQLFWSTETEGGFSGDRRIDFPLTTDNAWHDYEIDLPVTASDTVNRLRFDPGAGAGYLELDYLRVVNTEGTPTTVEAWEFEDTPAGEVLYGGWQAEKNTNLSIQAGRLHVETTGDDPVIVGSPVRHPGPLRLEMKAASQVNGPAQLFWAVGTAYTFGGERSISFELDNSGKDKIYSFDIPASPGEEVIQFRLDPGTSAGGVMDIDYIRLFRPASPNLDTLLETWEFRPEPGPPATAKGQWIIY